MKHLSNKIVTKDHIGKLFLLLWIPAITIVIGYQMINHIIAMPLPEDYKKINKTIPKLRHKDGWLMVHVIYEYCSCTNALTESILARGPVDGVEEWILFVGEDNEMKRRFKKKGFNFIFKSKGSLKADYGIEAAPLLLLLSPNNSLEYSGGYFERPSVYRSLDQKILEQVKNGNDVEALPLYGCAVSARLQELTDPFGIKYWQD